MAAVGTNIAGGDGPAYVICALPYRADVDGGADWGLDTALAIVEEAVDAFDPPRIEARPVRTGWPPELQDKAKVRRREVLGLRLVRYLFVTEIWMFVVVVGRTQVVRDAPLCA